MARPHRVPTPAGPDLTLLEDVLDPRPLLSVPELVECIRAQGRPYLSEVAERLLMLLRPDVPWTLALDLEETVARLRRERARQAKAGGR